MKIFKWVPITASTDPKKKSKEIAAGKENGTPRKGALDNSNFALAEDSNTCKGLSPCEKNILTYSILKLQAFPL
jgi:hypothetical protein